MVCVTDIRMKLNLMWMLLFEEVSVVSLCDSYTDEIKLNVDAIIHGGKCGWFV